MLAMIEKIFFPKAKRAKKPKRQTVEELRRLPYWQYLQSEHWKQTRERAIKRDGRKCRLCDSTIKLECHHRPSAYQRLGAEKPNDIVTLCHDCHTAHHRRVKGGG